jgi:putative tricarboxylic transport membrane protein
LSAERVSALFWLTIGLISIYGSTHLGFGTLQEPGSGFLSFLAGCFICLMAIIVFFQSFFSGERSPLKISTLWRGLRWHRPIAICLLTLGYILALERIGFLLTGFLLLFIILKGVENLSWRKAMLIPVSTLGVSYLLFHFILKATLPKGIFGF